MGLERYVIYVQNQSDLSALPQSYYEVSRKQFADITHNYDTLDEFFRKRAITDDEHRLCFYRIIGIYDYKPQDNRYCKTSRAVRLCVAIIGKQNSDINSDINTNEYRKMTIKDIESYDEQPDKIYSLPKV